MYAAGDTVVHPSEGVCTVVDIRSMQFQPGSSRRYYILHPEGSASAASVYIPVERGDSVLRRPLSRTDVVSLIQSSAVLSFDWPEDSRARRNSFNSILSSGDHARILRMDREIRSHEARRAAEGKRPCASDRNVLEAAEKFINQEFSYVLNLDDEATAEFISEQMTRCAGEQAAQ